MKTPFKLKYKSSAFPFKTGDKPKIVISPSTRFTMSTESGEGGGYVGIHKPTEWGNIGFGIGGGGSYGSFVERGKEESFKEFSVIPTVTASFNLGGKKKQK